MPTTTPQKHSTATRNFILQRLCRFCMVIKNKRTRTGDNSDNVCYRVMFPLSQFRRSVLRQNQKFCFLQLSTSVPGNSTTANQQTNHKKKRYKKFVIPKARSDIPSARVKMTSSVKTGAVVLTGNEDSLFSMLRVVVTDLHLGTTVRVAGGWVRDKLLYGSGKDDVDICLDNMTGEQFCHHINEWAKTRGKAGFKFGVIQSNPEKSKHLATATVKINGLEVDFVNLRSETYVENSRIPLVEFGTPLEDARRRDLTVNSLFYNIHTDEVEDYTGFGLEDMRNRVLRTPLDPYVTLIDDPLRAFRVLRFACRLRFTITPPLLQACSSPEVVASLTAKVSRERILKETEGTLTGDTEQSSRAVYLLHRLGLLRCLLFSSRPDDAYPHAVLADGITEPMTEAAFSTARERGAALMMLIECMGHLLTHAEVGGTLSQFHNLRQSYASIMTNRDTLDRDKLNRRFAALTHPFHGTTVVNPLKPSRTITLSDHILQNEIKAPSKACSTASALHDGMDKFRVVLSDFWGAGSSAVDTTMRPDRGALGRIIKDCGPLYQEALFMAAIDMVLDEILPGGSCSIDADIDSLITSIAEELQVVEVADGGFFARMKVDSGLEDNTDTLALVSRVFMSERCRHVLWSAEELYALIHSLGLHGVWSQPPMINGKDMKKLLPKIPNGPAFSEVLQAEFMFRMLNPSANVEAIAAHLQQEYSQFK